MNYPNLFNIHPVLSTQHLLCKSTVVSNRILICRIAVIRALRIKPTLTYQTLDYFLQLVVLPAFFAGFFLPEIYMNYKNIRLLDTESI